MLLTVALLLFYVLLFYEDKSADEAENITDKKQLYLKKALQKVIKKGRQIC